MKEQTQNNDILFYGNVTYFSKQNIRYLFDRAHVAVVGPAVCPGRDGSIRRFQKRSTDSDFSEFFRVYDFGTAVFVSGYLTFEKEPDNEIEELRKILHQCRKHGLHRAVILVSQDLCGTRHTSRSMELAFMESLCRYYADENMRIQIIRCPFLGSGLVEGDRFRTMFETLEEGKDWEFSRSADEKTNFITTDDLDVFLLRLLDRPAAADFEVMDLRGYSRYTFGQAAEAVRKLYPSCKITCKETQAETLTYGENVPRERFGWFARQDMLDHLDERQREYLEHPAKKKTRREKILEKLKGKDWILTIAELILGAVLMELLNYSMKNTVQFRMIDVRLLYVVLLSSVYGLKVGTAAAFLACLSLAAAYRSGGIGILMLFYQANNWLPFILYLTASSVCGLTRDRQNERQDRLSDRIEELQKENAYTDQLYDEALNYKKEYKDNLIRSRDGFGRIFEVVQKLAVTEPTRIYGESVKVIEDILDNDSVAIYSVSNPAFARLEVSSRKLTGHLSKSIRLEEYSEIVESVSGNRIWVNRALKRGMPVYAIGISSENQLRIIIFLYHAEYTQMNSYYENLIRVLKGLIQSFMLEAWAYQKATEGRNHIEGTSLVTEEIFKKELSLRRDLADKSLAGYCLIRISGGGLDIETINRLLKGQLRKSYLVTKNEKDGDYYILMPQLDQKSEPVVLERFRKLGLSCTTAEIRGGTG